MAVLEPTDPIWAAVESGLRDQWYAICVSSEVDDKPVGLTRLGERLVIWRDTAGAVRALEDRCPHRGASLSLGSVQGDCIACGYHGVQVAGDGTVASVPALERTGLEGRALVRTYPIIEHNQTIYAWFGSDKGAPPGALDLPSEVSEPEWDGFQCTATWQCHYLYAFDNLVDPMHGSYLHAQSHTLSGGARQDRMVLEDIDGGFTIARASGQRGMNFDSGDFLFSGIDWIRIDVPYPHSAGPGGPFRIIGYVTPIDESACVVFFYRLRRVEGWARNMWRFLYKTSLEGRHWHVLEQDRIMLEAMPCDARYHENLYQHDIGVSRLRHVLHSRMRDRLSTQA
jgi:phenylpropionate dioxygenase-like ring-hydroxylating dioxygenase large terminal subunit